MSKLVLVELVGPLVDDRGAISRTPAEVVAGLGVELFGRPQEQVAGGEGRWALETILGGHGRDDLAHRIPEMLVELHRRWEEMASGAGMRPAPGAARWIEAMARHGREFVVTSQMPVAVAEAVAAGAGLGGLAGRIVAAAPPRPDALAALFGGTRSAAAAVAMVASPAAAMAAIGARIGEIVLVGSPAAATTALPVDRWVAGIDQELAE